MSYQPFLIAPFATGLDIDQEPWMLPQDAFSDIINGHIDNGVIEKRNGYIKLGDTVHNDGGDDYNPGLRVMGLERYIDSGGGKEVIAFDTERACKYNPTTEQFDPIDTADIMNGSNTDYIWAANWASTASSTASTLYRLYFTNGKQLSGGLNGIRYYNGGSTTTSYAPLINSSVQITGCKLIFAFKDRLLLLHTIEGATTYPQRARWCQVQNPDDSKAWDDNVAGRGGFFDAPTGDHIVSAQFVQDILIVFFTNSVWTLRATPDPALPFRWDRINNFRACDGKMTTEQFDRYVIAAGVRGITATDGVETRRFDNRIESFVKDEINDGQFAKVFSRRSFDNRKLWMLYPKNENEEITSALIYDEESSAFSKYDISMNVLGYGGASEDATLADFPTQELDDSEIGDNTLQDFFYDEGAEIFLGGNTSGEIFILEDGSSDDGDDIEFSLVSSAWNPWIKEGKQAQFGYIDLFLDANQTGLVDVKFFKDNDYNPYLEKVINLLPNIGEISSISDITQANPGQVKSYGHGLSDGDIIYIYNVQGMDGVNGGQYTVTVIDRNNFTIGIDTSGFDAYTNGGLVTELPYSSTKIWKRIYVGATGYQHKIKLYASTGTNALKIHAFMPWFRQTSTRPI